MACVALTLPSMQRHEIVITSQNQVELQTNAFDLTLLPTEFLVETEFSFISAGTELAIYTGLSKDALVPGNWCSHPFRPGYGNVGIVRAIGERVTRVKPGQRIFAFQKHASLVKGDEAKYEQGFSIAVPEGLDPAIAAASRMAGVAATAVIKAELPRHPWVVVFGLGAVGNLAAQAFGILGARVIGVDPNAARRKLASVCNIPHVLGGTPAEVLTQIRELTEGQLAHISVEAAGNSAVALQALQATAQHGQLILLGTARGDYPTDLTPFLNAIHTRFLTVRGAHEWCIPAYPPTPGNGPNLFDKQRMIFDWIMAGRMQIAPLISHRMEPSEIKQAYDGLLLHPETYTGVVLDWTRLPRPFER